MSSLPYRTRPCRDCPWRRDAPAGRFPPERYAALADTSGTPGREVGLTAPVFACHLTQEGREKACAGWLAVAGVYHLGIRYAIALRRLPERVLTPAADWPELFTDYAEMSASALNAASRTRRTPRTLRAPRRPPPAECESLMDFQHPERFPHGTPLLWEGQLQAGRRDATFLSSPDVHSIKARHVIVASHRYGVGSGTLTSAAACDPVRIAINTDSDLLLSDASEVHPAGRCRRPGCRELFTQALSDAAQEGDVPGEAGTSVPPGTPSR